MEEGKHKRNTRQQIQTKFNKFHLFQICQHHFISISLSFVSGTTWEYECMNVSPVSAHTSENVQKVATTCWRPRWAVQVSEMEGYWAGSALLLLLHDWGDEGRRVAASWTWFNVCYSLVNCKHKRQTWEAPGSSGWEFECCASVSSLHHQMSWWWEGRGGIGLDEGGARGGAAKAHEHPNHFP